MAQWIRKSETQTLGAAGADATTELLNHQEGEINAEGDLVIVDGIVTVVTNSDDLCGVRLLVVPELLDSSDFNENVPESWNDMVYYSWFVARGPLVFRSSSPSKTLDSK